MLEHLKYLRYLPKLFFKEGSLPFYLIHFVTADCTCRCGHCLLGERKVKLDELTIDEIERITQSLPSVLFMFITGGEPFLREDLPDIIELYYRNCRVRKFQIPSNGSLTDMTMETIIKALERIKDAHLSVTLSLDAVGEEHDRVRAHPGLFDKATTTFRELSKLEKLYDNFNVNVTITVSANNQDHLVDIYHYARDVLGAKNIFNTIVRGNPRDPATLQVDPAKFAQLNDLMEQDLLKHRLKGYMRFPFSHFVDAKNLLSRRLIERIYSEGRYFIPCYAGRISMVLFSDGDVHPCEVLGRSYGNVRDFNYDVRKLWFNPKAQQIKRFIQESRCFCTHECFITHNILFNPRMLPRLMSKYLALRLGRL